MFGNRLTETYSLMTIGFFTMLLPFAFPALAVTSWAGILGCFVGMIVLIFAIFSVGDGLGKLLFLVFTVLTGSMIYPTVMKFAAASSTGIVGMAIALTGIIFFVLSIYSVKTKRDFTGFGNYIFIALLVLILAIILNMFFKLAILNLIISYIAVIVFSFSIIYDTQVIRSGVLTTAQGALSLFLNVVNIFLHLLTILED